MNKNSKQRRAAALKAGSATFQIPRKMSGDHGSEYHMRTQTITIGHASRKSDNPKVARRWSK